MGRKYKISITPNTSLWMKLGRTKYTIPKALSELIDNSIDNRINNKVNVDIYFTIDGNKVGILDNAKGMDVETLARALTIAEHQESPNEKKIGEHGVGLESATSYLGRDLTIYTKTDEMDKYLKFNYNQQEFLEKNKWTVDYEYISKEKLTEETGLDFDRGTYILVENLNIRLYNGLIVGRNEDLEGTMISKFQSIYKKFIEKNILTLKLHVTKKRGGVDIIKIQAPQNQKLTFKVNFNFKVNNDGKELSIKGWAGVLDFYDENRRNKKKYTSGFDIISKNKVILQHLHPGYSYHPEKRLVLGEIELENFQTTSDKTDFIRNSDWQSLELLLNHYITKPTLYLASTAYLNALCDKVANGEDFDFNEDFTKTLNRYALSDIASEAFARDLLPASITECSVTVDRAEFINSKAFIIDYMERKRAQEIAALEQQRIREEAEEENARRLTLLSTNAENEEFIGVNNNEAFTENRNGDSIENILENLNDTEQLCIEDMLRQQDSSDQLEISSYDIIFNQNNLTIEHYLTASASPLQCTFEQEKQGSKLIVRSNSNRMSSVYKNMASFCAANILNSIIDNTYIVFSQDNVLTPDTVYQIRASIMAGFNIGEELFIKHNRQSA